MRLDEVILVTENRKGVETNYLYNFKDYLALVTEIYKDNVQDLADAIDELYRTRQTYAWSENYVTSNRSFQMKFCVREGELRRFLLGLQNDKEEQITFDEGRCSAECFEVLKAYGIGRDGHSILGLLHYEPKEHIFERGEILHNLNGSDYRVLSVLSERNLLLMAQSDGQYIVATDVVMYERFPKEGYRTEDSVIKGVEWGHGIYLGHDIMGIDFESLGMVYGREKSNPLKECHQTMSMVQEAENQSITRKGIAR